MDTPPFVVAAVSRGGLSPSRRVGQGRSGHFSFARSQRCLAWTRATRALLPATGLVAIWRVFRALSASAVVRPLLDEPANPLVLSERQRAPVALPRFVAAAEPTKQIGASKVERRVLLQGAATLDALEQ